jgi:MFS family permease
VLLLFALSRWAGALIDRYGAKGPLVIGPLVAAAGFALFAVPTVGGGYWTTFFPAVLVLGLGMSITVAPLTTAVMNAVDPGFEGAASGINNAASRVAALIAIALFGIVMATIFNRVLHRHLEAAELAPAAIEAVEQQRGKLAAIEIPGGMSAREKVAAENAIALAFVSGFRWVMLISAALALASAASAWILIGSASRRPNAAELT